MIDYFSSNDMYSRFIFVQIEKQMNITKNMYINHPVSINLKAMLSNNVLHRLLYFSPHALVYLLMVKQNLLSHLDPNLKQKFVSIENKTKKKSFTFTMT